LYCPVTVSFYVFHLGDYARPSLDHCAGNILALRAEYAGHSDFSSYNSRHVSNLFMLVFQDFAPASKPLENFLAQKGLQR
jgi:hypothetical protein